MVDHKLRRALECLFEQGRDPMFITDGEGNVTHANPAFYALYQYTEAEIINQNTSHLWQNSMHDQAYYSAFLDKLKNEGQWSGELHVTSKSGEIIPVWTQVVGVDDSFSVTQVDLRDRDKMTRKMENLSRLQSVATLAGGVAHEFNNILGGIQGHLYLFKRQLSEITKKEQERFVRIDSLMERATVLVQNLLAFSKQKVTLSRAINLNLLLEETVGMYQRSLDANITLTLHMLVDEVTVQADPVVLKQHVFELISNAESAILHQRNDNSYEHTSDECIDVQLQLVEQKNVEILVRDNGIGMQDATLRHCLDPFFTTEAVGRGTGLGLSSAQAYMEQLHGKLDVESVFKEYTTIKISLPVSQEDATKAEKHRCILLIDDDHDLRHSMEEILNYNGYKVLMAGDGVEGLDVWHARKNEIDAIVMDVVMPRMNGIETAREIRKENENIPLCLTTGYSHQVIPASLHVNLIRKPLNPDLLLEFLEASIQRL